MRLIIAGTRTLNPSVAFIRDLIKMFEIMDISEIVSGGANGVDSSGEHFASHYVRNIKRFEANWDKYGKSAGPKRNKQMAEYSDCLLLIWDGKSLGSANMKSEMEKQGKPIFEVILKGINE